MIMIAGSLLLHRSGWLYIAKQSSSAASGFLAVSRNCFVFGCVWYNPSITTHHKEVSNDNKQHPAILC